MPLSRQRHLCSHMRCLASSKSVTVLALQRRSAGANALGQLLDRKLVLSTYSLHMHIVPPIMLSVETFSPEVSKSVGSHVQYLLQSDPYDIQLSYQHDDRMVFQPLWSTFLISVCHPPFQTLTTVFLLIFTPLSNTSCQTIYCFLRPSIMLINLFSYYCSSLDQSAMLCFFINAVMSGLLCQQLKLTSSPPRCIQSSLNTLLTSAKNFCRDVYVDARIGLTGPKEPSFFPSLQHSVNRFGMLFQD